MSKIYWSWSNIPGSLKRIWQNITKGWNDSDCWSLEMTIAEFILPRLKRFKEIKCGTPCNLTSEEWDIILDKMIYSFYRVLLKTNII